VNAVKEGTKATKVTKVTKVTKQSSDRADHLDLHGAWALSAAVCASRSKFFFAPFVVSVPFVPSF
jgi:hypothetical protein